MTGVTFGQVGSVPRFSLHAHCLQFAAEGCESGRMPFAYFEESVPVFDIVVFAVIESAPRIPPGRVPPETDCKY